MSGVFACRLLPLWMDKRCQQQKKHHTDRYGAVGYIEHEKPVFSQAEIQKVHYPAKY